MHRPFKRTQEPGRGLTRATPQGAPSKPRWALIAWVWGLPSGGQPYKEMPWYEKRCLQHFMHILIGSLVVGWIIRTALSCRKLDPQFWKDAHVCTHEQKHGKRKCFLQSLAQTHSQLTVVRMPPPDKQLELKHRHEKKS